jgi:uncharacterized protein (UPF0332 family)
MTLVDELRAMLAKARRYVDTAKLARQHGDYDTAVSRLYYAMFYCAEAALLARGRTFSSHRAVIAAFGREFAKTGTLPKELHRWLQEAFEKRGIGDYELETGITEATASDLQAKAQQFVEAVEAYLQREHLLDQEGGP